MNQWENGVARSKGGTWAYGSPSLFLFGIVIPFTALSVLGFAIDTYVGLNEDVYAYFLFGAPVVVTALLLYFGDCAGQDD